MTESSTSQTSQTRTRLADGRELVYYDDVPGIGRGAPDQRTLPPLEPSSELRYDRLFGEHVVIAAHRQGRTLLPPAASCPLCPGHPESEIPADDYHVAVFENRFPALTPGTGGRCEVVCFTSDHDSSFAALPAERVRTVGRAWADRTNVLRLLPGVAEVVIFENRGRAIGATLQHPHGQIYAYPFVTPRTRRILDRSVDGCVCCAAASSEVADSRIVAQTGDFVAFVPYAARWPYEVRVLPRRHVPDLATLPADELAGLMAVYADVIGRLERLFAEFAEEVPYMAVWHQAPVTVDRARAHLWAEIYSPRRDAGKLKYLASTETGAGAFSNDVLPEDAAARLRAAAPSYYRT